MYDVIPGLIIIALIALDLFTVSVSGDGQEFDTRQ
jgi:hypothetical protein